jgi:hypothetical protein
MAQSDLLKQAKRQHKAALRNKIVYNERRDNIVRQILNSETPNWGSLKIDLVRW